MSSPSHPTTSAHSPAPTAEDIYEFVLSKKNSATNNIKLKDQLLRLDKNLLESKQNVVRHIIKARLIENSIAQTISVDNTLHGHVLDKISGLRKSKYVAYLDDLNEGTYKFHLDEDSRRTIEMSASTPTGVGKVIYNAMLGFDDSNLLACLDAFDCKAAKMDEILFTKITAAASNSRILYRDSVLLYRKANEMSLSSTRDVSVADVSDFKWRLLKRLLRKKVLTVHLAETVVAEISKKVKGKTLHTGDTSTTARDKLDERSLSDDVAIRGVKDKLLKSLQQSQNKQQDFKSKISNVLTELSTVKDLHLKGNQGALNYARKVYLTKLEVINQNINKTVIQRFWTVWKAIVRIDQAEGISKVFLRKLAALKVLSLLQFNIAKKMHRSMKKHKRWVDSLRSNEKLAAALEVQRFWRGGLGRCFAKKKRQSKACVVIQTMLRRRFAIFLVKRVRHYRKLKASVLMIERLWKANNWRRTLSKIFKYNRSMRNATTIQRVYRGHLGRFKARENQLHHIKVTAAIKFQCLLRKYTAVLKVDQLVYHRNRQAASITIQRLMRGAIARMMYTEMYAITSNAKDIQRCWRRYKAVCERHRRKEYRSATKIQSVFRGRKERKRFQWLVKRQKNLAVMKQQAYVIIRPIVVGYVTRKRWKGRIAAHVQRRRNAANTIKRVLVAVRLGNAARKRCVLLRAALCVENRKSVSATKIQKVQRGIRGRQRYKAKRAEHQRSQELTKKVPMYYVLKRAYFLDQTYFHKAHIIKIQCAARQRMSRNRMRIRRLSKYARVIQRRVKLFLLSRKAKKLVEDRKKLRKAQEKASVVLQTLVRGFVTRLRFKRHHYSNLIQWFLRKLHSKMITARALANFRVQRAEKLRLNTASSKIGAYVRMRQKMKWFKKSRKKLTRQRNARIKERRDNAATRIQTVIFRATAAKIKVMKQRKLLKELEEERVEFEFIEQSLDGLHGDWLTELCAIKLETGARGLIARKAFMQRVEDAKTKIVEEAKKREFLAAARLQGLARGIRYRKQHARILPTLKKERMMRSYCVECVMKIATKKCRSCKDKFCTDCFALLHRTGNRKTHSFENIRADFRLHENSSSIQSQVTTVAEGNGEGVKAKEQISKKKDWEEFFDATAKAKYWFNQTSGEATWVCPF